MDEFIKTLNKAFDNYEKKILKKIDNNEELDIYEKKYIEDMYNLIQRKRVLKNNKKEC